MTTVSSKVLEPGQVPEEDRFQANMLRVVDVTYDLLSDCWKAGHEIVHPSLVEAASKYLQGMDKTLLIRRFIQYSYLHWDMIKEGKEEYFIKHSNEIFCDLPMKDVDAFGRLFKAKTKTGGYVVAQSDREALIRMFGNLVKCCIKYIHRERGLKLVQIDQGIKPSYTKNFFPEIKLQNHAKKWEVALAGLS